MSRIPVSRFRPLPGQGIGGARRRAPRIFSGPTLIVVTSALLGVSVTAAPVPTLILAGAACACALLCAAPTYALPSVALAAYALLPTNYLPGNTVTNSLSPGLLVLAIWLVRVSLEHHPQDPLSIRATAPAIALASWLVVTLAWSIDLQTSIVYTGAIGLLLMAPFALAERADARTIDLLTQTWLGVASALSCLAILERITETNPLGSFYQIAQGRPLDQVWAVYRVTTTLGHPLANAFFFSATVGLSIGILSKRASPLSIVSLCLALTALTLTASRAGLVAAGGAAVVVLAVSTFDTRRKATYRLGIPIAAVCLGAIAYYSPLVQDRLTSDEAAASGTVRSIAWTIARTTADAYHYVGSGPGTSTQAVASVRPTDYILESSLYQLLISIGIPGLILMAATILSAFVSGVRYRNYGGLGLLAACTLSSLGFNMAESYRPGWLLFGLAVILARQRRTKDSDTRVQPTGSLPRALESRVPVNHHK